MSVGIDDTVDADIVDVVDVARRVDLPSDEGTIRVRRDKCARRNP